MSTVTKSPSVVPVYVRPDKPPKPKVALVGFCQNTRHLVPYDDPDIEVWGLNRGYTFQPKYARWFETHGKNIYEWKIRRPERHPEWLKAFPGPIYMHDHDPEYPNSIAYPLEEVAADVGANVFRILMEGGAGTPAKRTPEGLYLLEPQTKAPYLTSTIAYQLALAIHERFEEIQLYGIDLNTDSEYAWQKCGVEYLCGIAAGRGIRVIIPDDSALLKGKLYGRGFKTEKGDVVSVTQMEVRLKSIDQQIGAMSAKLHQIVGAIGESQWHLAEMTPGIPREKMAGRFNELNQAKLQVEAQINQLHGARKEVLYMISLTPEGQEGNEAIAQLQREKKQAEVIEQNILDNGYHPHDVLETEIELSAAAA